VKRLAATAGAALSLLGLGASPAGGHVGGPGGRPTSEYIVGFRAGVTASARASVAAAHAATVVPTRRLGEIGAEMVTADAAQARALAVDPRVRYVEPNRIWHADSLPSSPTDPMFGQLWGLQNTGQTVNGTAGTVGADIGAVQAWQHGTGSSSVVVADIDSGMLTTHPDLAANLWINPGENCSGCRTDGIDNDGNGYVDDWRGWDFVNHDNLPDDQAGHGTHTAGTIGAVGDNGIGVIGVDPHVSLMPLKFINANGTGTNANAIQAVIYAADNGARVINGSWGGGGYSQALSDAIAHADAHGVLYVASAGNSASDAAFYPAALDLPNVISTAASDQTDELAWWSTFGDTVDLAAPGQDTLSTLSNGSYGYASGTSMAAPHVTGSAALLFSQHPQATPETIKALLFATATPLPSLAGKVLTGSRLDVGAAADCAATPDLWIDAPRDGFVAAPGHPVKVRVLAGECASPAGVTVTATVDGAPLTLSSNGAGLWSGSFTPSTTGALSLHAEAGDGTATADRASAGQAATELPVDGAARSIATVSGTDAIATFTLTAGHRISVLVGSGSLGALEVTVTAPDGTRLLERYAIPAGGGFIDPVSVAIGGVYWIRLHPLVATTGSVPISLYDVPPDVRGSIVAGGAPVTVGLGTPGQKALLGFTGIAGHRISARISGDTIAASTVQIRGPDGKLLVGRSPVGTSGAFIDPRQLTLSGAYTLSVDPIAQATGQVTLTVYDVPPDVTGSLTLNGASRTVTLGVPGMNARLTFSGASGQHVTVRLTADSIASAKLSILRPGGTTLAGPVTRGLSGGTLAATLPAAGVYTILIDPVTYRTGTVTAAVTSP
jgi:subtilisin family serine protease